MNSHELVLDPHEVVLSRSDAAALVAALDDSPPHEPSANRDASLLADVLDSARLVAPGSLDADIAALDTEVTYVERPQGPARTIRLVLPARADGARGRVSVFAPVGRALLGRRVGSRVRTALPDGALRELHIVAVVRPAAGDHA